MPAQPLINRKSITYYVGKTGRTVSAYTTVFQHINDIGKLKLT